MSDEEKEAIEYLKARLYGNEGCKFIDIAQSDLRIFLNLVENQQKDIENWKKYCDEQENDITLKNNKICDLEFEIENQSKEIEELKNADLTTVYLNGVYDGEKKVEDKIKAKIEEVQQRREKDGECELALHGFQRDAKIEVLQSLLEKE